MNLEQSIVHLDESLVRKSFLRTRPHISRDDNSLDSYSSDKNKILAEKMDLLYESYLYVLQSSSSNQMDIFDTVLNLKKVLENLTEEMEVGGTKTIVCGWIRHEINIWKLIYALYKDRLFTQKENMDQDDLPPLVTSEKLIVEHLYLSK